MKKNVNRTYVLLLSFFMNITTLSSCDLDIFDNVNPPEEDYTADLLQYDLYAENGTMCQSACCYGNYAFFVKDKLSSITKYDMEKKESVYTLKLKAQNQLNAYGNTLYHCNQSCFGSDYYEPYDRFPLMYISQRNDSTYSCFANVIRVIDDDSDKDTKFNVQCVQIIHFPPMTQTNAMGNVNVVIDSDNHQMYTYSRNNNKSDRNYNVCRISRFNIPNIYESEIYLTDADILESYEISCSALNMQGGTISHNKLYIPQGMQSVGYINLRVVDLEKRCIERTYDMLGNGISWEPEGCYIYSNDIYMTSNSNNNIYIFPNLLKRNN